jgi:hypothetical protein
MTDPMVSSNDPPRAERVEVITSVQRRRRWTTGEKVGSSMSVSVRQLRLDHRLASRHQRQLALHLA